MGETPLMHAARVAEPVAFTTIANILPKDQVRYVRNNTRALHSEKKKRIIALVVVFAETLRTERLKFLVLFCLFVFFPAAKEIPEYVDHLFFVFTTPLSL